MYGVPQAGLTVPAVAGQLERGVRPRPLEKHRPRIRKSSEGLSFPPMGSRVNTMRARLVFVTGLDKHPGLRAQREAGSKMNNFGH